MTGEGDGGRKREEQWRDAVRKGTVRKVAAPRGETCAEERAREREKERKKEREARRRREIGG